MASVLVNDLTSAFAGTNGLNYDILPVCLQNGIPRGPGIHGTPVRHYVDASWTPNGSAIGILTIYAHGSSVVSTPHAVLQAQPFPAGVFANNNDAETHGLNIATQIALINGDDSSTIITDSAVAIRRAERSIRSAQQMRDLTDSIPNELDQTMDAVLRTGLDVQIVHTFGHQQNSGNLIADLLAKQSSQSGQQIFRVLTIPELRDWVQVSLEDILRSSRSQALRRQLQQW